MASTIDRSASGQAGFKEYVTETSTQKLQNIQNKFMVDNFDSDVELKR